MTEWLLMICLYTCEIKPTKTPYLSEAACSAKADSLNRAIDFFADLFKFSDYGAYCVEKEK